MSMPTTIKQAVIGVWITIAVSAIVAVIDKRMGTISNGDFVGCLFVGGLLCIFPYKLSKGSNPSRYIFSILTVIAYLVMMAGITDGLTKIDIISTIILLPVNIFIIWRLFSGEANDWFINKRPPALPNAP